MSEKELIYREDAIAEFEAIKVGAERVRSMAETANDPRGIAEMEVVAVHMEEAIEMLRSLKAVSGESRTTKPEGESLPEWFNGDPTAWLDKYTQNQRKLDQIGEIVNG